MTNIMHIGNGNAATLRAMIINNQRQEAPPSVGANEEWWRELFACADLIKPLTHDVAEIADHGGAEIGCDRLQRPLHFERRSAADVVHQKATCSLFSDDDALSCLGTETNVTNADGWLGTGNHLFYGIGTRWSFLCEEVRCAGAERA